MLAPVEADQCVDCKDADWALPRWDEEDDEEPDDEDEDEDELMDELDVEWERQEEADRRDYPTRKLADEETARRIVAEERARAFPEKPLMQHRKSVASYLHRADFYQAFDLIALERDSLFLLDEAEREEAVFLWNLIQKATTSGQLADYFRFLFAKQIREHSKTSLEEAFAMTKDISEFTLLLLQPEDDIAGIVSCSYEDTQFPARDLRLAVEPSAEDEDEKEDEEFWFLYHTSRWSFYLSMAHLAKQGVFASSEEILKVLGDIAYSAMSSMEEYEGTPPEYEYADDTLWELCDLLDSYIPSGFYESRTEVDQLDEGEVLPPRRRMAKMTFSTERRWNGGREHIWKRMMLRGILEEMAENCLAFGAEPQEEDEDFWKEKAAVDGGTAPDWMDDPHVRRPRLTVAPHLLVTAYPDPEWNAVTVTVHSKTDIGYAALGRMWRKVQEVGEGPPPPAVQLIPLLR